MNVIDIILSNKKMAKELLEEYEEFYPFAYGQTEQGELKNIAGLTDSDMPESLEVVEELKKVLNFSVKKHDLKIVSICMDVVITPKGQKEKSDALNIWINSANDSPVEVLIPYKLVKGVVTFGEMERYEGEQFVSGWNQEVINEYPFPVHGLGNHQHLRGEEWILNGKITGHDQCVCLGLP